MINSNKGVMTAKITIGETEISGDSIYSVTCEKACCESAVSVGNLILPTLKFSISADVTLPVVVKGLKATFYIGLSADGTEFEYAPVQSLVIDSLKKSGELYSFETKSQFVCVDTVYKPTVSFPSTAVKVVADISSQLGVTIDATGIENFTISNKPEGYTCREVLCAVAERCGVNVHVDRNDSKLFFKLFEDCDTVINPDCCDEPDLAVESENYNGVSCTNETSVISSGSIPYLTLSNTLGFITTSSQLSTAKTKVTSLEFYPGTLKLLLGNILFDPWDLIGFSYNQQSILIPACSISHSYNGGLTTEIKVPEISSSNSDGTAQNTTQEQLTERLIADLVSTKLLAADKVSVQELEATKAEIESLYAKKAEVESLFANAATIEQLTAVSARISTLEATSVTAEYVSANFATIDLANVQAGSITTALIGTGAVNTAQIADGSITDAKIVELTANKITAGTLSVERLEIRGSENSIVYALNNITGALQSQNVDTLNGEILTERSITADKIVANSITSDEIAAQTITANEIASNTITSDKLKVTSLSSITANLGTITAGIIQSTNYSTTSGMKLDLTSGTWTSPHLKITASGDVTASNVELDGKITTVGDLDQPLVPVSGECKTLIHDGVIECFFDGSRIAKLMPMTSVYTWGTGTRVDYQYGILASGNYDGIVIGGIYNEEIQKYYQCNIQELASSTYDNCRHHFWGDLKFEQGKVNSHFNFESNYGVKWGDNIGLWYTNQKSPNGLWLGITGDYACPTVITGSETVIKSPLTVEFPAAFNSTVEIKNRLKMSNAHIEFNSGYGIKYNDNTILYPSGSSIYLGTTAYSLNLRGNTVQINGETTVNSDLSMGSGDTIRIANNYGIACGDNIAFMYSNGNVGQHGSGIYVGIDPEDASCSTRIVGSSIHLHAATTVYGRLEVQNSYINFDSNYGIKFVDITYIYGNSSNLYCGSSTKKLYLRGSTIYTNNTSISTASDARMKQDITPLADNYLQLIKAVEPVSFKYSGELSLSGRTHTGFIAQQVQEAMNASGISAENFAAFVDLNKDGEEYALRYEEFIPLLLLYIQSLDRELQTLKGQQSEPGGEIMEGEKI